MKKITYLFLLLLLLFSCSISQNEQDNTNEKEQPRIYYSNLIIKNNTETVVKCNYSSFSGINCYKDTFQLIPDEYIPDNHKELWSDVQKIHSYHTLVKPIYLTTKNFFELPTYNDKTNITLKDLSFDLSSDNDKYLYLYGPCIGYNSALSSCQLVLQFDNQKEIHINGWKKEFHTCCNQDDIYDLDLCIYPKIKYYGPTVTSIYQVTVVINGDTTSDIQIIKNPVDFLSGTSSD